MLVLEGQKVRLRDFTLADHGALAALSDDEPMFRYTKSRLDHRKAGAMVERFVAEAASAHRTSYTLVVETHDGTFAGWAGLTGRRKRRDRRSSAGISHPPIGGAVMRRTRLRCFLSSGSPDWIGLG